jgi:hypothetical protein
MIAAKKVSAIILCEIITQSWAWMCLKQVVHRFLTEQSLAYIHKLHDNMHNSLVKYMERTKNIQLTIKCYYIVWCKYSYFFN